MKKQLMDLYLDWINNYLTIEKIAEDYGFTPEEIRSLIALGYKYHEERVGNLNFKLK